MSYCKYVNYCVISLQFILSFIPNTLHQLIATNAKEILEQNSVECRLIFGKRTLSTSSRNLKAEEGWGEIDIFSTKGLVDSPLLRKSNDDGSANYRQFITLTCAP